MGNIVRSPLRYPGGKSRALPQIFPLLPDRFREFREPMVGGGSVFLGLRGQRQDTLFGHHADYWINDLNPDVSAFWTIVRDDASSLVERLFCLWSDYQGKGRDLYEFLRLDAYPMDHLLSRAVRFFVMNRITFSGVMDAGGYSQQAFEKRFTRSSIERVKKIAPWLEGVQINTGDYGTLLHTPGDEVFIFLDPPYLSAANSRLYGKRGELHTGFDHHRFAAEMQRCSHRWLITYDDSPEIRDLFHFARLQSWELQYGMNNVNQSGAAKGKELFIMNY